MLYFIIQWIVYGILLMSVYKLFLQRQTHFGFSRAYLLAVLPVSFALACIHLPFPARDLISPAIYLPAAEVKDTLRSAARVTHFPWLKGIYLTGCLLMLGLSLWRLRQIQRLFRSGEITEENGYRICRTVKTNAPGSFLRTILLPAGMPGENIPMVLAHERVHVRKLHSLDLLFLEFLGVFLYFHPLLYWIRRELLAVHEYQADGEVAKDFPVSAYKTLLLQNLLLQKHPAGVHSFGKIKLKTRFQMMNKQRSGRWASWKAALAIPALAFATMAFSLPGRSLPVSAFSPVIPSVAEEIVNPEFKGGQDAMMKFLQSNLVYPEASKTKKEEGSVVVSFVVKKDGKITNVKVKRGVSKALDEEAVRVVRMMPDWKPGMKDGVPADFEMVLPVSFKLQ
jgi:TonB family protein